MKKNPADAATRDRMQPGAISAEGFLGADDRPIAEIVAADEAVLEEAGVTREQLGDMLEEIHRRADEGFGATVPLGRGVKAELTEVMGRIPCPFGCGARAHKAVIRVTLPDERQVLVTPLHAHLIREHGFFQGGGSVFRLEPRDVIAMFRLLTTPAPDADSVPES